MMSEDRFEVTWETDDGYVGGSRPHHFNIQEDDLSDDETDTSLSALFQDMMQADFEQTVSPYSGDEEEFIEWAKQRLAERSQSEK